MYLVYLCAYTQTLLGNTLVSMTLFSCLIVSQVVHYLHPLEPSIKQGMDHNLSQWIV